jgi:hypothetical protein
VILLDQVIEVFDLSKLTAVRKYFCGYELTESLGVGSVFIYGDHQRKSRMRSTQGFREKRLAASASRVALNRNSTVFPCESTAR